MGGKRFFVVVAGLLALASLPIVDNVGHAVGIRPALTISDVPTTWDYWPQCSGISDEYCWEQATQIAADGTESPVTMGSPYAYCHGNARDSIPCPLDGSYWLDIGFSGGVSGPESLQKTFRWKLRTGRFSPDVTMMGDTKKLVVSGNETDGWVMEFLASPAMKADHSTCHMYSQCGENWTATSVSYGISGYTRMLGVGPNAPMPRVATASLRDALRGTVISTNGKSQSWDFSADTFYVNVQSPHFLPPDSSGKSEITPGFVKVFLPKSYITFDRGYTDLAMVTPDRVQMTVSEKSATAKVTVQDHGLLIDTGVTHFSAPNPQVKVLKSGEAATNSLAPLTPNTTSTTSTTTMPKTLNRTAITSAQRLAKGSTRTLSSLKKTTASQRPQWTASGACRISGTRLIAAKKSGTCKVILKTLNSKKKHVVTWRKSFQVS